MVSSWWQTYTLTVVLAVLTVAALTAAIVLELAGEDASKAWDAFAGFAVFFAGVHVPAPAS